MFVGPLILFAAICVVVIVLYRMFGFWGLALFPAALRGLSDGHNAQGGPMKRPKIAVCPYPRNSWRRKAYDAGWDEWMRTRGLNWR